MEILFHCLTFFLSIILCVCSIMLAFPVKADHPLAKIPIRLRICIAFVILATVAYIFYKFTGEYVTSLLFGYALSGGGALFGIITSHKNELKAWAVKKKTPVAFFSLLLVAALVIKLLDSEYERGKANGIEYAKEELVDTAYESGYEDGKSDAIDEHSGDYDKGYDTGYENAVSKLEYEYAGKIDDVYDAAYEEGYESGYEAASSETPVTVYSGGYNENEIYRKAYENAADQLRHEYEEMIADAYDNGYDNGYSDGEDSFGY